MGVTVDGVAVNASQRRAHGVSGHHDLADYRRGTPIVVQMLSYLYTGYTENKRSRRPVNNGPPYQHASFYL